MTLFLFFLFPLIGELGPKMEIQIPVNLKANLVGYAVLEMTYFYVVLFFKVEGAVLVSVRLVAKDAGNVKVCFMFVLLLMPRVEQLRVSPVFKDRRYLYDAGFFVFGKMLAIIMLLLVNKVRYYFSYLKHCPSLV